MLERQHTLSNESLLAVAAARSMVKLLAALGPAPRGLRIPANEALSADT